MSQRSQPKEATELLVEALKSMIKKFDDDDKPKAKEAETVKLPDFPNPETYRSWKITVREAVRAASDKPDEAFKWVQEIYKRSASMELLRETGKFLTLATKILSALSRVAKGDLARQIINYKESEATANRAIRGRQVLLIFSISLRSIKRRVRFTRLRICLKCSSTVMTLVPSFTTGNL